MEDAEINSRLVAYCSDQAHSSVEKAGLIGLVKIRYIESDDNLSLRGDKLKEAIEADRENGYVPFFVSILIMAQIICSTRRLVTMFSKCQFLNNLAGIYVGKIFLLLCSDQKFC